MKSEYGSDFVEAALASLELQTVRCLYHLSGGTSTSTKRLALSRSIIFGITKPPIVPNTNAHKIIITNCPSPVRPKDEATIGPVAQIHKISSIQWWPPLEPPKEEPNAAANAMNPSIKVPRRCSRVMPKNHPPEKRCFALLNIIEIRSNIHLLCPRSSMQMSPALSKRSANLGHMTFDSRRACRKRNEALRPRGNGALNPSTSTETSSRACATTFLTA